MPPPSPFTMETASINPQHRIRRSGSLELIHLDVPIISTRRSSTNAYSPELYSVDTSRRVPFLWERVPGVPKDGVRRQSSSRKGEDFFFFPPKPPPGRPHQAREAAAAYGSARRGGVCNNSEDDGNDGDVDSWSNGGSEEELWVSDAVDKVCLPHCRDPAGHHRSPSFIMNRFLPAASAIAASSTPTAPKHPTRRSAPSTLSHRLQRELIKSQQQKQQTTNTSAISTFTTIRQAHQPHLASKACGFQVFFPWTFKQTPCGHKNPVRCQTPGTCVEISGTKSRRFSFNALRMNERAQDNLSSKAFKSPGWGLPFLDTSRLRLRSRDNERERGREFMEGMRGGGKPTWSLPRLQRPSEPWLSRALNTANRRY